MRISERRFSIPECVFAEPIPSKAFKLLCFLFSQTDFGGLSRPGYDTMRLAIRDSTLENGSKTTIRAHLKYLQKRGWIFHMKRTNGKMAIWLQIPPRYRRQKAAASPISVVQ